MARALFACEIRGALARWGCGNSRRPISSVGPRALMQQDCPDEYGGAPIGERHDVDAHRLSVVVPKCGGLLVDAWHNWIIGDARPKL